MKLTHHQPLRSVGVALTGLVLGLGLTAAPPAWADPPPSIDQLSVPAFNDWTAEAGEFHLTAANRVVIDSDSFGQTALAHTDNVWNSAKPADQIAQLWARDLTEQTGLNLAVGIGTAKAGDIQFRLVATPLPKADAYSLSVADSIVRITANTSSGLFNGGRTVLQALKASSDGLTIANGQGTDSPSLGMRTYTMDVSREYWEPRVVEDVIRQMGWLKQNILVFHFDDAEYFRLNSPRYPGLAEPEFSYDQATIRHFVEVGAENNVTVIPAFEYPAHVSHKASYFHIGMADGPLEVAPGFGPRDTGATADNTCGPAYTHSHLNPDFTFNFMNPKAMRISKEMLDEFVPWFDSPWVHIGGDEVPAQLNNCPAMQTFFASQGKLKSLADVEADFINQLAGHLDTLGKRTVVYNGFENGVAAPKVRSDVVVQLWTGSNTAAPLAQYDKLMGNGSQYYLVTGRAQTTSYPVVDNIFNGVASAMSLNLSDPKQLGIGMHIWGDDLGWAEGQYLDQVAYYPRAVTAERAWNYAPPLPGQTVAGFQARLAAIGPVPGYTGVAAPTPTTDGRPIHDWRAAVTTFPAGTFDAHRGTHRRALSEICGLNGMTPLSSNISDVTDAAQGLVKQLGGTNAAAGWHMGAAEIRGDWTFAINVNVPATVNGRVQLFDSRTGARLKVAADGSLFTQASSIDFALASGGQVGFVNNGIATPLGYTAPRGQWVQLVFVADAGTTILYANGVEVGRVAQSLPLPRSWLALPRFVQFQSAQIYAQALTPAQVVAQATTVPTPEPANCQAKPAAFVPGPVPPLTFGIAGTAAEDIEVGVTPGALTLTVPSNQTVDLGAVTANGADQLVTGQINAARVTDARGTNEGWTLVGIATNFIGDNTGRKIMAANLGWLPWANIMPGGMDLIHEPGAAAQVTAGAEVIPGQNQGLAIAKTLCAGPAGYSGGRFTCGSLLRLGVPFDTQADHYTSVLTLTLM